LHASHDAPAPQSQAPNRLLKPSRADQDGSQTQPVSSHIGHFIALGPVIGGAVAASSRKHRGAMPFLDSPTDRELSALRRIYLAVTTTHREHLQAGKDDLGIREVLALAPCDVSDRSHHDDGQDREFDRQSGDAADRP
jgi:hypothetical protein